MLFLTIRSASAISLFFDNTEIPVLQPVISTFAPSKSTTPSGLFSTEVGLVYIPIANILSLFVIVIFPVPHKVMFPLFSASSKLELLHIPYVNTLSSIPFKLIFMSFEVDISNSPPNET